MSSHRPNERRVTNEPLLASRSRSRRVRLARSIQARLLKESWEPPTRADAAALAQERAAAAAASADTADADAEDEDLFEARVDSS